MQGADLAPGRKSVRHAQNIIPVAGRAPCGWGRRPTGRVAMSGHSPHRICQDIAGCVRPAIQSAQKQLKVTVDDYKHFAMSLDLYPRRKTVLSCVRGASKADTSRRVVRLPLLP